MLKALGADVLQRAKAPNGVSNVAQLMILNGVPGTFHVWGKMGGESFVKVVQSIVDVTQVRLCH